MADNQQNAGDGGGDYRHRPLCAEGRCTTGNNHSTRHGIAPELCGDDARRGIGAGLFLAAGLYRRGIGGSERPHSRSEEHTSELQSLMRISYAVFCLKKKKPTSSSNPLTQLIKYN